MTVETKSVVVTLIDGTKEARCDVKYCCRWASLFIDGAPFCEIHATTRILEVLRREPESVK